MIIDVHTHIGDLRTPEQTDRMPVTADDLLRRLDEEGIDKAVVLPLGPSPESMNAPFLFTEHPDVVSQIRAAARHSDRFIVFGNLDPRMGCKGNLEAGEVDHRPLPDYSWLLERFKELGCVGIGEVTANVALDDPRLVNMVRQCGERGLPVLFHETGPGLGVYGVYDEVGSPRLERLLREAPAATLIGHAPGFWAEVSGDIEPKNRFVYPSGPIRREGSLPRLLRSYPNLYADISAMSGFNAISRDRAFGARFLEEFRERVLLGTDVCFGDAKGRMPHLSYLRQLRASGELSPQAFEKITGGNAERLLSLAKR